MSGKFSVFLVCEDLTFGASLPKNITYAQLLNVAMKKFNIGQEYDIVLSYNVGSNCVHIVDDDDMEFFLHQILKGKSSELHNIYIKKIAKVSKVNPSSSNTLAFDLNLIPDGYDDFGAQFVDNTYNHPISETQENTEPVLSNEQIDHKWKSNTFKYISPPPRTSSTGY